MTDPRDKIDIPELCEPDNREARKDQGETGSRQPFLSVWFRCCHVYGRLNRNKAQTAYTGRCPKCGVRVQALIGSDGTNRRVFEAC